MRSKIAVFILFMMMTLHIGNMPVFASDTESGGGSSSVAQEKGTQGAQKRDKLRRKLRSKIKKNCAENCAADVDCCEERDKREESRLDSGDPEKGDDDKADDTKYND